MLADTTTQVRLLEEERSQLEGEREELRLKTYALVIMMALLPSYLIIIFAIIRVELKSKVGELTVKYDEAMKQIDKLVQEKHALLATLEETHTVLDQLERDKINEQQSFMQEKASLQVPHVRATDSSSSHLRHLHHIATHDRTTSWS